MGFDNECILNIQSLPGEYFCPVCRTLVYPNEALQSQCTHLYCKPCLAYIVATTQACPYDGYLVTEADSKPLMESNKTLAETVGKVAVHCLYHRSGCQWQGTLSDCITHCTGCTFGNSPVVCNRCGTQIIHRQVQEHAQICPGLQLQAQQVENTQVQASTTATQAAAQDPSAAATSAVTTATATTVASTATPAATATQVTSSTTATATAISAASASTPTVAAATAAAPAPASVPAAILSSGQGQTQVKAAAYQQAVAQAPTADQWYQQQQLQYQQYYQQYPGYNPYQQYQQYGQYQQAYQQYVQPQMQVAQGQQPSPYVMPQPNAQQHPQPQSYPLPPQQSQPQVQPQLQPQSQAQAAQLQPNQQNLQLQPQPQPNAQVQQMLAPQSHVPPQQPLLQAQPPAHPPSGAQVTGQQFGQPLPQPLQNQPQPHAPAQPVQQLQPPPYQQLLPIQHPQPQQPNLQPHPQQQPHAQPQLQAQPASHPQPHFQQHMQLQPHSQPQPNAQLQPQPLPQAQLPQLQPQHSSTHAVTGHQSYPQAQPVHQFPPGAPQQHPIHMHPQQQGIPQNAVKMNNQFAPQQPPQMRPPQGQFPGQVQQQSTMLPPQGPHANIQQPQQQQLHHLVSHHAQQVQQHPGIHPHAPHQGLQPQQANAPLQQPGQPYQHGMLPSQPPMHPQQPVRPHGPSYLQQQVSAQSYSQQSAPQGQGLPVHQAQVVAGRPTMMMSHGMTQQPFQHSPRGPSKYVQPGVTNPMVRSSTHMPTPAELQGVPPHTAGQGAPILASPASVKPTKDAPEIGKEIVPKIAEGSELGVANRVENEGSVYAGSGTLNSDSAREGKAEGEAQGKKSVKVASELAQHKVEGVEYEDAEAVENKPVMKEEVTDPPCEGTDSSVPLKDVQQENENKSIEGAFSEKPGAQAEGDDTHAQPDDGKVPMPRELSSQMESTSQSHISQDQGTGNIAGSMQASQQMPAPGGLDRGQLQQPSRQNILPHEGSFPQPGYHSGHPPEFARQGPISGVVQGMAPSGPIPGHERYPPPQQTFFAHPSNMTDTAQRPPGPAQHMQHPGATQERRFQEPPPPYFMQAHRETFPQPPPGQQPYGSFHSEVPARTPGQLQVQSHMNVGGIRPHGESVIRPAMGGPPPGLFDTARGPPFGLEDQVGRPRPVNALEAESYAARGPGFSDGRQPEPPFIQSGMLKVNGVTGKGPVGSMHGSSFREERIRSLPEDGFKAVVDENHRPYPVDPGRRNVNRREFEEDLKQFPRPAHLDGEGLSKFDDYVSSSRPLERGQELRPFERAPGRSEGVPSALPVRPLLPYQTSGPFPSGSAALDQRPMEIGERHRHVGFHEDFGRISGHPDLLRSGAEFGHHRMDGLPPLRSPGREYGSLPSSRFGLANQPRFEDFDGIEPRGFVERSKALNFPPDHFLRGIPDGPGGLRNMDQLDLDGPDVPRSHFRPGDSFGSRNLPSILRGGEYLGQGPLRLGDPTGYGGYNMPGRVHPGDPLFGSNYSRHGFPNEAGHFSSVSLRGDMDTFEHPRKRIAGSMGWCRICRVDCETVEGLDLHSQTREHQKTAMDMVLNIKQEVGKKQKLSSDEQASIDDTSKSRKANFENRGNRQ
ncbi:uncharacterized protein [Typha latifolia]|uniref:uncharacterized protein isoform X1 n=1 Tax=Typha latifolia TaxID=4733 RepID=UPI003C2D1BAC